MESIFDMTYNLRIVKAENGYYVEWIEHHQTREKFGVTTKHLVFGNLDSMIAGIQSIVAQGFKEKEPKKSLMKGILQRK